MPFTSVRLGKHTVIARDEMTGKYERIHISAETRKRFKDVGKPRRIPHVKHRPLTNHVDLEWRAEKQVEHDNYIVQRALEARLYTLRNRLEAQAANKLSLEERLEPRAPFVPDLPLKRE